MRRKKVLLILIMFALVGALSYGFYERSEGGKGLGKTSANDDTDYIAVNQIKMWIGNNGMGSHDPVTDGSGMYWPGGENATITAIFADGLIFGAKLGREIRVGGATYRYGLQAGKILDNGLADDPSKSSYRIYDVRKGDSPEQNPDVAEWPWQDGAPWVDANNDGIYNPADGDTPEYFGDQVLWCVSNDLDPGRTTFLYGTLPMGVEIHTMVFGFNRTGDLGNMVFKKYKIINKGTKTLKDMVLGYWSDTDLGDANDDFTGCDTLLSLGYTYNGDNNDAAYYGENPPANGYDFFQGPIIPYDPNNSLIQNFNLPDSAKFLGGWRKGYTNLPMTGFTFYINGDATYSDPDLGVANGSVEMYNYLTGRIWNGLEFIDPHTSQPTVFCLAGDPVGGTGWYEGPIGWPGGQPPGDRRHLMASGPFSMAPGDTQEVVVGILMARGANNIASVTELKRLDNSAQTAYDLDFDLTPAPSAPRLHGFSQDQKLTLWWETNAESYDAPDPLIYGQGLADTTYTFEGYRIWQFSDLTGSDPKLLAVFDLENGIKDMTEQVTVGGVTFTQVVFSAADEGVSNYYEVTVDKLLNTELVNGSPYFFAVTAYGYSQYSVPLFLESPPVIQVFYPRKPAIDESYPINAGDDLVGQPVAGDADATVNMKVVDPSSLKNAVYRIELTGTEADLSYMLINKTSGDTLLRNMKDFGSDSTNKPVAEGFYVRVVNEGKTAILGKSATAKSRIKDFVEVVGGEVQGNVFDELNSTGAWKVVPYLTTANSIEELNINDNIGYDDYEFRFVAPGAGSEFYTAGYSLPITPWTKDDILGKGRIPVEVWNTTTNTRYSVKILDKVSSDPTWVPDSVWTLRPNGQYEPLFVQSKPPYVEPMPAKSGSSLPAEQIFGKFVFSGALPAPGTVVRVTTHKPLQPGDAYEFTVTAGTGGIPASAKDKLDQITVYPNPYFGTQELEQTKYSRFVRFLGLPKTATIRIYTLSGVFIKRIDKTSPSDFVNWNLLNSDNLPVASGMYLAHIDMPGIGTKIMKIAVIMETQYIDRM